MAFCRLLFPLVLSVACLVHSESSSGRVPVFLWGDLSKTSLKSSPLSGVTPEEFTDILSQELSDEPFTVVFIEETLSVEDFSLKNSDGETSYPYLHKNIPSSVYLPSVDSPVSTLDDVIPPGTAAYVKLTENGLSAEIEAKKGKFLLITLSDAKEGETRAEFLRRHNDFMENMVGNLKAHYGNVVALYTADYPSWTVTHSRSRRATNETGTEIRMDNLLIVVDQIILKDGNNTVVLTEPTAKTATVVNSTLQADLTFSDKKLSLHFSELAGYWFFNKVLLTQGTDEEELEPKEEVYSITGWAYRCGQNIVFASVNTSKEFSVTFTNSKIQPFFTNGGNETVFGDSLNCVGFFSAPIWACLFVVFILLAIMFYGIMMMLDIRTMDRFDDPKGKTITISATE